MEKYLLRESFENDNLLPKEILWRKKEAFSDGVSSNNKSWTTIIQEKIQSLPSNILQSIDKTYIHNNPITKEQQYYRYLFDMYYKKCGNIIPYFWMPKYVDATDSSARTLSIYNNNVSQEEEEDI
jgi:asparagine synthase (glutamine-hydrolysing)